MTAEDVKPLFLAIVSRSFQLSDTIEKLLFVGCKDIVKAML